MYKNLPASRSFLIGAFLAFLALESTAQPAIATELKCEGFSFCDEGTLQDRLATQVDQAIDRRTLPPGLVDALINWTAITGNTELLKRFRDNLVEISLPEHGDYAVHRARIILAAAIGDFDAVTQEQNIMRSMLEKGRQIYNGHNANTLSLLEGPDGLIRLEDINAFAASSGNNPAVFCLDMLKNADEYESPYRLNGAPDSRVDRMEYYQDCVVQDPYQERALQSLVHRKQHEALLALIASGDQDKIAAALIEANFNFPELDLSSSYWVEFADDNVPASPKLGREVVDLEAFGKAIKDGHTQLAVRQSGFFFLALEEWGLERLTDWAKSAAPDGHVARELLIGLIRRQVWANNPETAQQLHKEWATHISGNDQLDRLVKAAQTRRQFPPHEWFLAPAYQRALSNDPETGACTYFKNYTESNQAALTSSNLTAVGRQRRETIRSIITDHAGDIWQSCKSAGWDQDQLDRLSLRLFEYSLWSEETARSTLEIVRKNHDRHFVIDASAMIGLRALTESNPDMAREVLRDLDMPSFAEGGDAILQQGKYAVGPYNVIVTKRDGVTSERVVPISVINLFQACVGDSDCRRDSFLRSFSAPAIRMGLLEANWELFSRLRNQSDEEKRVTQAELDALWDISETSTGKRLRFTLAGLNDFGGKQLTQADLAPAIRYAREPVFLSTKHHSSLPGNFLTIMKRSADVPDFMKVTAMQLRHWTTKPESMSKEQYKEHAGKYFGIFQTLQDHLLVSAPRDVLETAGLVPGYVVQRAEIFDRNAAVFTADELILLNRFRMANDRDEKETLRQELLTMFDNGDQEDFLATAIYYEPVPDLRYASNKHAVGLTAPCILFEQNRPEDAHRLLLELGEQYRREVLTRSGSYDCVIRMVLNADDPELLAQFETLDDLGLFTAEMVRFARFGESGPAAIR